MSSGNVPSTTKVGGNVPNSRPASQGNVPSTVRSVVATAAPRARATSDEIWPPLGRQPDGTFIWQYGPEWLKLLWSVEGEVVGSVLDTRSAN
jgi:hypothetical protein